MHGQLIPVQHSPIVNSAKMLHMIRMELSLLTGTETEYCGTDLVTKEATPPVTVGSHTTKVECR